MATITLNPGKERPVQQRHPWVFSGAVARVQGYVGRGDAVDVCDASGEWLARGTWSSGSQIRARLFTWNADEPIDEALFRRRLDLFDWGLALLEIAHQLGFARRTDQAARTARVHQCGMLPIGE